MIFDEGILFEAQTRIFLPVISMETYLSQDTELNDYVEAFKGIKLTVNVLEWPEDFPYVQLLQLLGPHRTPLEYVLVKGENPILLSYREADIFMDDPGFYSLTLGFYSPNKKLSPEMLEKIVKIKFLNGDSHYTNEELPILKNWLKAHGTEKMSKLFLDKIIGGDRRKVIAYQGSQLQRIFEKEEARSQKSEARR